MLADLLLVPRKSLRGLGRQFTTEELGQLLGVKPQCQNHKTIYPRGEWCFTKVGKVYRQSAWKVIKEQIA